MYQLIEFIPFLFLLMLVFAGLVTWLIVLQIKYNELSQKNEKLERYVKSEFSSYDTLLDSLEAEIDRRCSAISRQQNADSAANQQKTEQNKTQSAKVEQYQSQPAQTEQYKQTQPHYTRSEQTEPIKSEQIQSQSVQSEQTQYKSAQFEQSDNTEFKKNVVKDKVKAEKLSETNVYKATSSDNNKEESANRVKDNINENSKREEKVSKLASDIYSSATKEEDITQSQKLYDYIYTKKDQPHKKVNSPAPKEPVSFVQLFSWLGGFILLLGVIFGIKYALENDLVSPAMRIVIGSLIGIGLWVGGALLRKPNVKTTSDTLCACGLCTLYSVWFSAYYFYHMTSPTVTFVLLSLVAIASFATAVWKDAQYIGVLAQIIGFLTPALFPSEEPKVWFLLTYVGIINVAAVAAALKRNWTNQLFTGLAFTFLSFLSILKTNSPLELTIFPGVFALFYTLLASYKEQKGLLRFAFAFTTISLLIIGFRDFDLQIKSLPYIVGFAGFFAICFGILGYYKKDNELIISTLIFAFLSFILIAAAKSFIALFVFVIIISLFFGIICSILNQPYLQIGTMILTALGFISLYLCSNETIVDINHLPYLAGFSVFFVIFFGGLAYYKKNETLFINSIVLALVCYALLVPFENRIYLISLSTIFTLFFGILSYKFDKQNLMTTSIAFTSISLIFISTLGLEKLNLILSFAIAYVIFYEYFAIQKKNGTIFSVNAIAMVLPFSILTGIALFKDQGKDLLAWIGSWNLLLMLSLYFCKKHFENSKVAWVTLSLCNIFSGMLIAIICEFTKGLNLYSGRVTFGLVLIYGFLTERVVHWSSLDEGIQRERITYLICAPIIFLTLAIPLQVSKEVMTICFAIEGLGLIILWHFLPINLVQYSGYAVLLILTTPRLLLNPFIEDYYPKTQLIWNWYLYTYLICASAMFGSGYCWKPDTTKFFKYSLNALGVILLFALVNIEIANYFSNGIGLKFHFSGELAEAATYTIAWTIFGAICMFLARFNIPGLLYTGISLISLSVIKLFFSDIWELSSGLRIVVLIAVAIIMLVISFIYQQRSKFLNNKKDEYNPPPSSDYE